MAPFPSGLLVLTAPLGALPRRAAAALAEAAGVVTGPLYVHLQPGLRLDGPAPRPAAPPPAAALLRALAALYAAAAAHRGLDVRVLLGHGHRLARPPRVLLADGGAGDAGPVRVALRELAAAAYGCPPGLPALLLSGTDGPEALPDGSGAELPAYPDVAVGGTFDRLHGAHRLLLSACCLLARRRLLVGVADGELLRHKVLRELIEPYELRAAKLREFLLDVQPSVLYDIVPLGDPYGPAITDPELRCIVVSSETRRGGEAVNKKRIENGLAALELFEIELMEDPQHGLNEEEKISSSSLRQRLLGTLLQPPRERLKSLTDIVWPEIARMVREQIAEAGAEGKAVVVLDAAVLLEAGWQEMVHEVWAAIIPEEEAVKRIVRRDGLSEEAARSRLRSQMSDSQRVRQAQVVLCTLWEPEVTRRQVDAAYGDSGPEPALFMDGARKGSVVSRANSIGSTSASSVPNTDDEDSDYPQEHYKESYKDQRRRAHTQAEQKRRNAIKKGYDDLQAIVPTCQQQDFSISSQKLSKAIILQKTIDYIQFLHKEKKKQEEEVSTLRKDVMALKIMKVNYEQIVKAHQDNPSEGKDQVSDQVKFNVFQGIMDSLFESFNASISVTSFQELSACVFSWIEEHCKPHTLRDIVMGVLHQVKSQLY